MEATHQSELARPHRGDVRHTCTAMDHSMFSPFHTIENHKNHRGIHTSQSRSGLTEERIYFCWSMWELLATRPQQWIFSPMDSYYWKALRVHTPVRATNLSQRGFTAQCFTATCNCNQKRILHIHIAQLPQTEGIWIFTISSIMRCMLVT